MPATLGGITIDPGGLSLRVNITLAGNAVTAFTSANGSTRATLPATITTRTTYHLAAEGVYVVSAKYQGHEIANASGGTTSVQVTSGSFIIVNPTLNPSELPALFEQAYFGNAAGDASTQYPGTGTPATSNIAFTLFHYFGQSGAVAGTTQGGSVITKYFNITSDDSAESFSSGCYLVDTGTPFTQTKPVVGIEGDAFVQGGNTASSTVAGVVGWVKAQNTAQITGKAVAFYASAGSADAGALISNYYGLYVEAPTGAGTITNQLAVFSTLNVQCGAFITNATTGGGFYEAKRQSADANAPTTGGRIYARDNGSGKNQLVVRFPTGAVQVLATEP